MKLDSTLKTNAVLLLSMLFVTTMPCSASDHIDFSGGLKQTVVPRLADLTDLYSWVSEDGKLIMALNTYLHIPNESEPPEFDGTVEYKFQIRKVALREPTKVNFFSNQRSDNNNQITQSKISKLRVPEIVNDFKANVTCIPNKNVPNCSVSILRQGQLEEKNITRAVAGRKADSFILDLIWAQVIMKGVIDPTLPPQNPLPLPDSKRLPIAERLKLPIARNSSDVSNVLNLTVEIDIEDVFGDDTKLIAVAGESFMETNGQKERRDRVGRPELTNMTIGLSSIKDIYNKASTFELTDQQIEHYKALIRYGVLGWDRQDGKNDWNHDEELHDLLDILVLDALIVDTTVRCDYEEQSFLAIERGEGKHTSCGGRVPKDDVIDTMFSLYTVGIEATLDAVGDGADFSARAPLNIWPYFTSPELMK